MKHVIVGMSGGVDSAVCAYLLKQQGYEVTGVTLRTLERSGDAWVRCCDIDDASAACERIGIGFHAFNCTPVFRQKVIEPFMDCYLSGRTPNPCIECNRHVKWEMLLYYMKVLNADMIATGHYAHIDRLDNGRYTVRASGNQSKDQSYMLWKLSQEQLERTLMPLGDMTKEEVRQIAQKAGIPVADKPDSQEICFVHDDDYARFIGENHDGDVPPEGDFVDEDGNILGRHKGIIHYTIGQRKGLGIAMGRPVFVKRINPADNTVVLADNDSLYDRTVICSDINLMGISRIEGELRCRAKIRYHHTPQKAVVHMEDGKLVITFEEPVRAVTPGQSAVMYSDDGYVIGGGVIEDTQIR